MSNVYLIIFQKEQHYDIVCDWWRLHGHPVVPAAILPKLGVIAVNADNHNALLAASWLYMDNSVGVATSAWTVGNPMADSKRMVYKGVTACIEFLYKEAKEFDYGCVIASAPADSGMERIYEKMGWSGGKKMHRYLFKSTNET